MADRKYLERLTKELLDKGLLIESGWVSLRLAALPENAPALQLEEMRNAFFAGAQHVFSSIMTMLDPGEEPTDDDLRRMDLIHSELDHFITAYRQKHGIPDPASETSH
jgi:hypothetical protein